MFFLVHYPIYNLKITVTKILPDFEGIANAQIGNLIPLENALNRQCANKAFADKYIFIKSLISHPQEALCLDMKGKV